VEVTTVERVVREVEVRTTPGRSAGVSEMIANDADNRVLDFSLTFAVFLAGSVGGSVA
jgi:hypothetical protein